LLRVQRRLIQQLGREPTSEELAVDAGLDEHDQRTIACPGGGRTPLDAPPARSRGQPHLEAAEEPMSLKARWAAKTAASLAIY
jgi:RNA polymerase primary sigma factor